MRNVSKVEGPDEWKLLIDIQVFFCFVSSNFAPVKLV